jgi:aerobic-type carbon monoxide dehydrogenase small subunit (CoxS/CutS family)
VKVALILNGGGVTLEAGSAEMLLAVLRREGLLSVRETCGIGVCGACTVLLDGEPVSGCITLAAQAEGHEVTTVEGLGGSDPVQRAFVEARAFQCGWCTPGFVLTTKRLLEERAGGEPITDEEIAEALGGNLCRCGSYVKIVDAVKRAEAELSADRALPVSRGRRGGSP